MQPSRSTAHARRFPIGAELMPDGVSFRVWASSHQSVDLVIENGATLSMNREDGDHFSVFAPDARAGMRYRFRLSNSKELLPDPASRFQPDGVHGPSEIVDPHSFRWTDADWRGISADGQVLYEMHIGTFTAEGTWDAAIPQLKELKDLGITCLEVMPVAEFAGDFGWGYDGVDLFAPTRLYGKPDDFRRFIDAAHALGLGVILDVVYNHLGPTGNYVPAFSKQIFSEIHKNDWGQQLNFDGEGSAGVREYFITNARFWIREYHLDGYRFDATQAIVDSSPVHVLTDIAAAARAEAALRSIYLITENEPQETKIVRKPDAGGYGFDALWNDDFHHSANVALIGRNEAYFTDYLGHAAEFVAAAKWGYLYQGQMYAWQKKRRGTPALDLPVTAFVNYIQNHDQIANYAHGQRVHELSGLAQFRAMTGLLLLAPQTPLLFQGQEFAASSSFNYFADHEPELNQLIQEGRRKEMSQFPSVGQGDMLAALRDPTSRKTFERCILKFEERRTGYHGRIYQMHKDLLRLRREDPVFSRKQTQADLDGATLTDTAFFLRFFGKNSVDRLLLVNLGTDLLLTRLPQPLLAPPIDKVWDTLWSSEDPAYGGSGSPPVETRGEPWRMPGEAWRVPGRCAVVLQPVDPPSNSKQ